MLRIKKIYNNNVALVIDSKGLERILIGRGLAFNKKTGQQIEREKIDKTFIVDSPRVRDRFVQLANEVPLNHLELVTKIIKSAEKELNQDFDELTYIGLADHINYALSRYHKGQMIKNALLLEIKKFYPKEYAAGLKALGMIAYEENIQLQEDEAGFIAMHFVNGEQNSDTPNVLLTTEILQKVVLIVEDTLSIGIGGRVAELFAFYYASEVLFAAYH